MILIDTHAWIWWTSESVKLSENAAKAIHRTDRIGVSIISCREVAMLVAKQRIGLNMDVQDWIDMALEFPKIQLIPIDPKSAVLSSRLPGKFHGDPADQLIVATCLNLGLPLISKSKFILSPTIDKILVNSPSSKVAVSSVKPE